MTNGRSEGSQISITFTITLGFDSPPIAHMGRVSGFAVTMVQTDGEMDQIGIEGREGGEGGEGGGRGGRAVRAVQTDRE